jgi:hypothetical protein
MSRLECSIVLRTEVSRSGGEQNLEGSWIPSVLEAGAIEGNLNCREALRLLLVESKESFKSRIHPLLRRTIPQMDDSIRFNSLCCSCHVINPRLEVCACSQETHRINESEQRWIARNR